MKRFVAFISMMAIFLVIGCAEKGRNLTESSKKDELCINGHQVIKQNGDYYVAKAISKAPSFVELKILPDIYVLEDGSFGIINSSIVFNPGDSFPSSFLQEKILKVVKPPDKDYGELATKMGILD